MRSVTLIVVALLWAPAAWSADVGVGYLELSPGPSFAAAEQAARETHPPLHLVREQAESAALLIERFDSFVARGLHWFLLDLPSESVAELAYALRDRDVMLFNMSGEADVLRGGACRRNLFNVGPSRAMMVDALAQFLRARGWNRVLVLEGPLPEDEVEAIAFRQAAKKYGVKIAAYAKFDARSRDSQAMAALLDGVDYDAIYVSDSEGSIAALPTTKPLLGSAGFTAAPKPEWVAQAAILAVADAIARGGDTQLLEPGFTFDARRGPPLSFRSWDHQLRQPMDISADGKVVATAPFPEFAHANNPLDTLGVDRTETRCRF